MRFEFKKVGDYHVITSPDVPALYVADLDLDRAKSLVPHHLEALQASQVRRGERERVKKSVDQAA